MLDLSIIIVNYNTAKFLERCLDSIIRYTEKIAYEIIVVDNNSTENEIQKFPESYCNVKFIFNEENNGFGAGCNTGAKLATGKYIAFVNPDIELVDNSLLEFCIYLDKNENAGLCSGILIDNKNIPQYCYNYFPGIKWEFKEAFGFLRERTVNKLLNHPYIKNNIRKEFEVDWFHGACIVMNKDLFFEINGFDEKIFLYYEDVDLCKKIIDRGLKVICLPYVRIMHYMRSSVRSDSGMKIYYYYMHINKLYYMSKYFNPVKRIIVRIIFILGSIFKLLLLPFRSQFRNDRKNKIEHYLIILKVHLNLRVNI
jgi:GT2 family glycosyltransferase